MNVFNLNRTYRLLTTVLFLLSCAVLVITYQRDKGTIPMALFGIFAVVMLIYMVHAWLSCVWIGEDEIRTKSLTGTRFLRLSDVNNIAVMKLKGRYLFFLMTAEKYVMVSTIYENFSLLKNLLESKIPAFAFAEMNKIDEENVLVANKRLNLTLAVIFIVYAFLAVYFNYFK